MLVRIIYNEVVFPSSTDSFSVTIHLENEEPVLFCIMNQMTKRSWYISVTDKKKRLHLKDIKVELDRRTGHESVYDAVLDFDSERAFLDVKVPVGGGFFTERASLQMILDDGGLQTRLDAEAEIDSRSCSCFC